MLTNKTELLAMLSRIAQLTPTPSLGELGEMAKAGDILTKTERELKIERLETKKKIIIKEWKKEMDRLYGNSSWYSWPTWQLRAIDEEIKKIK